MFAKWIFTAAYLFSPASFDLPPMQLASLKSSELAGRTEVYETAIRQPCVGDLCGGILFVVRQRFVMCTTPGVWTFTVRLGLIAQEPMGGKVWLVGPDGSRSLMAAFNAAPGAPAYVAASLQAQSLTYDSCYTLRIEANQTVEVIAEPGVSFVTVGR